jgi:hypothetical protein
MTDESQLQTTRKDGESSLSLSSARSSLIGRGRRDAATLTACCNKCGEPNELILAGRVCGDCSDFLDSRWLQSDSATATEWILVAATVSAEQPTCSYYVYRNTTYAQMKLHWATWANASDILHFVPALFPLDVIDGPAIRPATPKEVADHEAYIGDDQALANQLRAQRPSRGR